MLPSWVGHLEDVRYRGAPAGPGRERGDDRLLAAADPAQWLVASGQWSEPQPWLLEESLRATNPIWTLREVRVILA